ncbi:NADH-quinone oxidoreductase subunit L [Cellulomonas sp. URHE0023]|uniref:NADH-quinone oxidoreductase subunit L n=1 Tax=Cellulomonas sp. URHE0023 TaxID=1380354 RepID=UPI00054D30BA|nr:NADH-quinone oxidoreductase subunit L [Cellulomonas sp. URHE0023]
MHTLTALVASLPSDTIGPATETVETGTLLVAPLLVGIPLLSAALLLVLGRRTDRWGHWLGVLASSAAFVIGAVVFVNMLGRSEGSRVLDVDLGNWIDAGAFHLNAGVRLDPLSLTFVLLVTFVGSLIHIYAVAYMEHDADRRRFFAYLNLFIAAMLTLVLANSYLLLFFGWEGVGLASYLLIGFWNYRLDYAVAAKKAFVANRIGDLGLIIAMGLMFATFGSVSFDTVLGGVTESTSQATLNGIALMLLLAACGKSAQFPLQSWLGDAMAGPTPVSALIHAATMVTAGVYLIVRSAPLFNAAPDAQLVVVCVGAVTLVFGAIVGCAKDDIKKALAASTMSQIGYMILAAGLGPVGYAFAIFHLVTHGFFKAGMFLGAGSVMHGMDDQVNMRLFGGLGRYMKITYITFGAGWLAIIGFPFFSGFYSKDHIIESAFVPVEGAPWRAWFFGSVAMLAAGITAFYMSRLFFMTFEGEKRWTNKADGSHQHPHEAPKLMTWPMIVLAVGSVGLGAFLNAGNKFVDWLAPVLGHPEHEEPVMPVPVIMGLTLALVAVGILIAWRRYVASRVPVVPPVGTSLTRAARVDLYQDTVNDVLLVEPGQALTRSLVYVDRTAIDGTVSSVGRVTVGLGEIARRFQTGYVRSYAASMLLGLVVLVIVVLVIQI